MGITAEQLLDRFLNGDNAADLIDEVTRMMGTGQYPMPMGVVQATMYDPCNPWTVKLRKRKKDIKRRRKSV